MSMSAYQYKTFVVRGNPNICDQVMGYNDFISFTIHEQPWR